jgi:hypothetical protein
MSPSISYTHQNVKEDAKEVSGEGGPFLSRGGATKQPPASTPSTVADEATNSSSTSVSLLGSSVTSGEEKGESKQPPPTGNLGGISPDAPAASNVHLQSDEAKLIDECAERKARALFKEAKSGTRSQVVIALRRLKELVANTLATYTLANDSEILSCIDTLLTKADTSIWPEAIIQKKINDIMEAAVLDGRDLLFVPPGETYIPDEVIKKRIASDLAASDSLLDFSPILTAEEAERPNKQDATKPMLPHRKTVELYHNYKYYVTLYEDKIASLRAEIENRNKQIKEEEIYLNKEGLKEEGLTDGHVNKIKKLIKTYGIEIKKLEVNIENLSTRKRKLSLKELEYRKKIKALTRQEKADILPKYFLQDKDHILKIEEAYISAASDEIKLEYSIGPALNSALEVNAKKERGVVSQKAEGYVEMRTQEWTRDDTKKHKIMAAKILARCAKSGLTVISMAALKYEYNLTKLKESLNKGGKITSRLRDFRALYSGEVTIKGDQLIFHPKPGLSYVDSMERIFLDDKGVNTVSLLNILRESAPSSSAARQAMYALLSANQCRRAIALSECVQNIPGLEPFTVGARMLADPLLSKDSGITDWIKNTLLTVTSNAELTVNLAKMMNTRVKQEIKDAIKKCCQGTPLEHPITQSYFKGLTLLEVTKGGGMHNQIADKTHYLVGKFLAMKKAGDVRNAMMRLLAHGYQHSETLAGELFELCSERVSQLAKSNKGLKEHVEPFLDNIQSVSKAVGRLQKEKIVLDSSVHTRLAQAACKEYPYEDLAKIREDLAKIRDRTIEKNKPNDEDEKRIKITEYLDNTLLACPQRIIEAVNNEWTRLRTDSTAWDIAAATAWDIAAVFEDDFSEVQPGGEEQRLRNLILLLNPGFKVGLKAPCGLLSSIQGFKKEDLTTLLTTLVVGSLGTAFENLVISTLIKLNPPLQSEQAEAIVKSLLQYTEDGALISPDRRSGSPATQKLMKQLRGTGWKASALKVASKMRLEGVVTVGAPVKGGGLSSTLLVENLTRGHSVAKVFFDPAQDEETKEDASELKL